MAITALYVVKGFLYILSWSSRCSRTLRKTSTALAIQTVKINNQNSKRYLFLNSCQTVLLFFESRHNSIQLHLRCGKSNKDKNRDMNKGLFFYESLKCKTINNPKNFQGKHLFALNTVLHSHFKSLKCPATLIVPLIAKAHGPTTGVT